MDVINTNEITVSDMEKPIIISKDNKKAIAIINRIRERKKALREFMLAGGSIENFNPNKGIQETPQYRSYKNSK